MTDQPLPARLRAYAAEYEKWNEASHYAPFKRDLYAAADALRAAEQRAAAAAARCAALTEAIRAHVDATMSREISVGEAQRLDPLVRLLRGPLPSGGER